MIPRVKRYGRLWPSLDHFMGMDLRALHAVPDELQRDWYNYHIERVMLRSGASKNPENFVSYRYHLEKFCRLLWGDPEGLWYVEFNPNLCEAIDRLFGNEQKGIEENKWVALAGAKNTGKSEIVALAALTFYLIDPPNSKVLVGSQTVETALAKVFSDIDLGWRQACLFFGGGDMETGANLMPGEMVSSKGLIKDRTSGRKSGIEVLPGDAGSMKKSAGKWQGIKAAGSAGRVMFATDETAEMNPLIVKTAIGNLTGNIGFKGIAALNPADEYDGSRPLCLPDHTDGFESVNADSDGWKTALGWCCHFDGLRSPNVLEGRLKEDSVLPTGRVARKGEYRWRGLYNPDTLADDYKNYPDKSSHFWQFVRGFWPPTGSDDAIYSAPEIRHCKAQEHATFISKVTPLSSCDPAFTHDGDGCMACFANIGLVENETGQRVRCLDISEVTVLSEDVSKDTDKTLQTAKAYDEENKKRGITTRQSSYDESGGGKSWGTVLNVTAGMGALPVNFGGMPSDLPLSPADSVSFNKEGKRATAKDIYQNKVSEIWHIAKSLMRSGQLKGLPDDVVSEMLSRNYETDAARRKAGKICVESKKAIRKRTGKSPDKADAVMIVIHLARERFDLVPCEKAPIVTKLEPAKGPYDALNPTTKGQFRSFLERRYGGLSRKYIDAGQKS